MRVTLDIECQTCDGEEEVDTEWPAKMAALGEAKQGWLDTLMEPPSRT